MDTLGSRASARRDYLKLTQTDVANFCGVTQQAIQKMEDGEVLRPRYMDELAEILKVNKIWLKTGKGDMLPPSFVDNQYLQLSGINVIGEVEAGIWREAVQWDESEIFQIPYGVNEKYHNKAYGLRIRGDSMNLAYPEDTIVIVVSIYDYDGEIATGKRVIVERCLKNGVCEATAKELEIINGHAKLWPRSTNQKYQDPIDISWPYETPQEIGLETVIIKGVIIGSYRSEE